MSLQAYRGLLAVGRLLDDPALVREALRRLEEFARRGFYYDLIRHCADLEIYRDFGICADLQYDVGAHKCPESHFGGLQIVRPERKVGNNIETFAVRCD